jgi:hypothetical protein
VRTGPLAEFTSVIAQALPRRDGVPSRNRNGPDGVRALTEAERSAAYRARRKAELDARVPVRIRYRRPADKRTRPQRWRDAVAELVDLQADYAAWLDRLPESLRDTATAAR